jgi:hypothetical protein
MMTDQQSLANPANEMRYQRLSYFILFVYPRYLYKQNADDYTPFFPSIFFSVILHDK